MRLPSISRSTAFVALFASAVFLLPLLLVRWRFPLSAEELAIATIGVGAVSRTLLRGVFGVGFRAVERSGLRAAEESLERSGLRVFERSVERSAISTAQRTAQRTLVRAGGRTLSRVFTRVLLRSAAKTLFSLIGHLLGEKKLSFTSRPWFSIPMALAALVTSFWIVTQDMFLSLLVIAPTLTVFALEYLLSRRAKLIYAIATPPDGIALQYLFAVTGGFMPLASESTFQGDKGQIARVSLITLVATLAAGIVLREVGVMWQLVILAQLGDVFLLFPLILSFPFPPLEGYYIFVHNKVVSILVWLASIAAFAFLGSEAISHAI